ncbi:MAG: sigma-70 family RNA polymerase sigma factor [Planctomycetota bacterium]|nr:sigma-70 family RNA polymerase sigma factor [Planctomycetota bacterium]
MTFQQGKTMNQAKPQPPPPVSATHLSLLESLMQGRAASESWPIFVEKYGRMMYRWSLRWGANPADAEEIVQETLVLIYQKIGSYKIYGSGTFRGWLKKVAYRCWLSMIRTGKLVVDGQTEPLKYNHTLSQMASVGARRDLMAEFDRLANQEILELASFRTQNRVTAQSWQCFQMTYVEHLSGQEAARRLGLSKNAVFVSVCRVRKTLREEILRLDPDAETETTSSESIETGT